VTAQAPLRVLHVIAGAPVGGAETFFLDAVTALAEAGLAQTVLCRPHPMFVERLRRAGVPFEPCSFPTFGRLAGTPALIRRHAGEWRADLVHAWMSRAASLVPSGMPCPVIGWLGGYYDRKYFRNADFLIGVTGRIREHLLAQGAAPERAFVCHTFGTLPDSAPVGREALGVPPGALLLLVLSRLHRKKGIDVAIAALRHLPEAHLVIAGDGPERARYQAVARTEGLAGRVHFLGWRDDRQALLEACDICLLPSRYEPFGTVIAEAWSMRRPLVAALADGAQQFVRDGENGVVFPIDDAAALARRIAEIAASPALATRLVENGWRDYRRDFSREAIVARLIEIYHQVIAAAARTPVVA